MSTVIVTKELFNNMSYDFQSNNLAAATGVNEEVSHPSVLIVFGNSDINAALYHLNKSLESPFDSKAIATVLVQESLKEQFVQKLQQHLKPYPAGVVATNENYLKALSTAQKLNAQLITVEKPEPNVYSPTLVCDFSHEQLSGTCQSSGVVTFHTFRTAKEAIALVNKEPLKFSHVSIWHENHAYAFELIAALKSSVFFINCNQVPISNLEETIAQNKTYVSMDKSYHYETLQHEGVQKSIVFPIGSIFAN